MSSIYKINKYGNIAIEELFDINISENVHIHNKIIKDNGAIIDLTLKFPQNASQLKL